MAKPSFPPILAELIALDARRLAALRLVRDLDLPAGGISGAFVRCAVFDRLHHHPEPTQLRSLEVVYLDPERPEPKVDANLELELTALAPRRPWSVFNLARLEEAPSKLERALQAHFLDTASSVWVALDDRDEVRVRAPRGALEDLFSGLVRPNKPSLGPALRRRIQDERWTSRFPDLELVDT